MSDKDLDQLFKNRLEDFNPSVPDEIWSRIETELPGNRVERKKRNFYRWWSVAAAVGIVLAGVLFWTNGLVREEPSMSARISFSDKKEQISPSESKKLGSDIRKQERFNESETGRKGYADNKRQLGAPLILGSSRSRRERKKMPLDDIGMIRMTSPRTTALQSKSLPDNMQVSTFSNASVVDLSLEASYQAAYEESQADVKNARKKTNTVGVSTILNVVVNAIQKEGEVMVSFSEDRDGILNVDLSHLLTKR